MTPYYERNGITIYCGDCLEVMPKLDVTVDTIIADPPYGTVDGRGKVVKRSDHLEKFNPGKWDEKLPLSWIKQGIKHLVNGGWFISFTDKLSVKIVWDELESCGGNGKQTFYWVKTNPPPQPRKNFCSGIETAVLGTKGPVKLWYGGGWYKNYFEYPLVTGEERTDHPTQKPVAVVSYLLKAVTSENHNILDPFMGSGTTLLAAQNEGRQAIGIELDEKFCQVAVERLRQPSFFSLPNEPKPAPEQLPLLGEDRVNS